MPGPAEVASAAPGLHGKLPARGDFVSRRLDAAFVETWDGWLQRTIAASREALGERWLECFLSAPVWRFLVPAGMFSGTGWIGLVVPSVDRVGRYFPLTLAAPVQEDGVDTPATLAKALGWLDALEALALEALAPELDFEGFDRRLAEHAPPAGLAVMAGSSDDTVPLAGPRAAFQVWQAGSDSLQELLERGPLAPRTVAAWATRGGEHFGACAALCDGLIPGGLFCALLDGQWVEHGWTTLQKDKPGVTYCPPDTPGLDFVHGQGGGEVEVGTGTASRGEAGPLTATPSSEQAVNTGVAK